MKHDPYKCEPSQIINNFTVLYECNYKTKDGHKLFHVRCNDCGFETDMQVRLIYRSKSCKHVKGDGVTKIIFNRKFWVNTRLNKIFDGMIQRCYNSNDRSYRWYGEKGIKIYQPWLDNPELFQTWALENGYTDELTINRKDEDKDYCPENCEWITAKDNAKYKSTTYILEVDGERHTGREWADILGLGTNIINTYLRKYDEEIVKQFIRERKKNLNVHRKSKQTWLEVYGISTPDEDIEV